MTTIHNSLESPITGKRNVYWRNAWKRILSLCARYQNRRSVHSLRYLSDHELADIGVTRDDLRFALRGGPFDDHSMDLMRAALRRRSQMYMQ